MSPTTRSSTKRSASDASIDHEGSARPTKKSAVVGDSEDDSVVEMFDKLPPKSNVAIVENLLDEKSAELSIDIIREIVHSNYEIEFKGTDICTNLVHVLKSTQSSDVRWKACSLIMTLTYKEEDGFFKKKLRSANAVEAVVEVMEKDTDHRKVQFYGCGAFSNLTCDSSGEGGVEKFIPAGCVGIFVSAMKAHKGDRVLQERAIKCLATLLCTAVSDELIGAVDPVISAMKMHNDIETLMHRALGILICVSATSDQAKRDIKQKGGAVVAAKAERKHEGKNELIHKGAVLLLKLLFS